MRKSAKLPIGNGGQGIHERDRQSMPCIGRELSWNLAALISWFAL
jgi:hypothetical protein